MKPIQMVLLLLAGLMMNGVIAAEESQLNASVVDLKKSVLQLNRDLYQLEEDLLSPATTRTALYFSLNYGQFFDPMSLNVMVDDKPLVQHLYTERQVKALSQGAIQPLDNLNLGPGQHLVKAIIKGVDQNGKDRELVAEAQMEKNDEPLYVEVKVSDNKETQSAELTISQW